MTNSGKSAICGFDSRIPSLYFVFVQAQQLQFRKALAMCEPMHSTIQFPDPDDFDGGDWNDDGDSLSAQSARPSLIGKMGKWFKKVGKFFHVSKMGSGHSETLRSDKLNAVVDSQIHSFIEPPHYKWEADWAVRRVYRDGGNIGFGFCNKIGLNDDDSESAAKQYINDVCIGSFTAFRRFFETSLVETEKGKRQQYVANFLRMLTADGVAGFVKKCENILGRKTNNAERYIAEKLQPRQLAALCLGFTRKRGLLIPEWADDGNLWVG